MIELLVVIAIIAILAGLLLPVVNKVTENARKVAARAAETQVVAAVSNYQTEYGQYPVEPPAAAAGAAATTDTTFGKDGHNSILFNVLRTLNASGSGSDAYKALNSRRIVYFEGKNVKNNTAPRDGFIAFANGHSSGTPPVSLNVGDFIDPWGNAYFVRIDTGYSNAVLIPYRDDSVNGDDANAVPGDILHVGAISYSYGADGVPGTKGGTTPPNSPYTTIGDDVVSWQ